MSASHKRTLFAVSLTLVTALALSACQAPTADDLWGQIKTRGTIRISTDPNYAPQ